MRSLTSTFSALALVLAACGNDTNTTTSATDGTGGSTSAGTGSTGSTTATTNTPTTSATDSGGATEGGSTTAGTTGGGTTGTTGGGTSTTATTGGVDTTGGGTSSSGGTTVACTCTPGDTSGCDMNGQILTCQDDCQTIAPEPCAQGQICKDGACVAQLCVPGSKVCDSDTATKQCNGLGDAFDPPVNCAQEESCVIDACVSLCAQAEATPSSVGCSFFSMRQDNYNYGQADSMIVGNTSTTKTAKVTFYFTPNGSNVEQMQSTVDVLPGKTAQIQMTNPPFQKVSQLRQGGVYRAQSTIPIVAYQHSPLNAQATNDASMLLPEHALRLDHVIMTYPDTVNGEDRPSYFNVIAIADSTTVQWTPPVATVAGTGVAAVAPGQTGTVKMNRFDALQIRVANDADISGTIVHSDKPVWVIGAVNCTNVPAGVTFCDHIEEQMIPLDYWGKQYVGAHSPKRGSEKHYWRVFAGEDQTTITTNPAQPGTPFTINKGQWKELAIANNTSFIITGDKPFLPIQYLAGQNSGAGTGDPASYQMVPVEQFLDRYAFVTGVGYTTHYAQVIRAVGNPDVKIDGQIVTGYYTVGGFEVADFKISEGAHFAESDAPFGILNIGYTGVTSYAYPGGLKLAIINPQ